MDVCQQCHKRRQHGSARLCALCLSMTYGVNVDALRASYKRLRDVGRRDRFEAPDAWLGRAHGVIAEAKTPEQIEAETKPPLPRYKIPGCGCGCCTEHGIYPDRTVEKENPQQPGD